MLDIFNKKIYVSIYVFSIVFALCFGLFSSVSALEVGEVAIEKPIDRFLKYRAGVNYGLRLRQFVASDMVFRSLYQNVKINYKK